MRTLAIRGIPWGTSTLIAMLGALVACAQTSPDARLEAAQQLVQAAGWQPLALPTSTFTLMAYLNPRWQQVHTLRVYIEGDGMSWIDPQTPSFDPTPAHPLALQLALQDTKANAVYLGRPCQYVRHAQRNGCDTRYWTSHRFAPEVMTATDEALTQLKAHFGATSLELVGYSGGGTVAAVQAARRHDVTRLITVAGNLDPRQWTWQNHLAPLAALDNPADMAISLKNIPQLHFVGSQDLVITASVGASYQARFPSQHTPVFRTIEGFDHHCCWSEAWPRLLEDIATHFKD